MALGTVVTAYEVGGWRLLLGAPAAAGAAITASSYMEALRESQFCAAVANDLRHRCQEVPEDFIEAILGAAACQYETNKVCLDVRRQLNESGKQKEWRVEAFGSRKQLAEPWSITSVRVSLATNGNRPRAHALAPQTRQWDGHLPTVWSVVYQCP